MPDISARSLGMSHFLTIVMAAFPDPFPLFSPISIFVSSTKKEALDLRINTPNNPANKTGVFMIFILNFFIVLFALVKVNWEYSFNVLGIAIDMKKLCLLIAMLA